jgi:hypothetical protein
MGDESIFVQGPRKMIDAFVNSVSDYGNCEAYAEKVSRWDIKRVTTQWIDAAEPMQCGFQVLSHGDLWTNNTMFKVDANGKPLDVSIFDFAEMYWGSPSNDLLYFLVTSSADDVDHFDTFVEFYYDQLTAALRKLNYSHHIPSLAEFQTDILEKSSSGEEMQALLEHFFDTCLISAACAAVMNLYAIKNDSPEEINLEEIMQSDDPTMLRKMFSNENVKRSLKLWLPFLDERGFLDSLVVKEESNEK